MNQMMEDSITMIMPPVQIRFSDAEGQRYLAIPIRPNSRMARIPHRITYTGITGEAGHSSRYTTPDHGAGEES